MTGKIDARDASTRQSKQGHQATPEVPAAAAALREQITAFPEKVLPTEMAPCRLISTQNEELMH